MNPQSQSGPDRSISATPPVSADVASEFSKTQSAGDGMLDTSFAKAIEKQPEADKEYGAPLTLNSGTETEYVPFYQKFAEHSRL